MDVSVLIPYNKDRGWLKDCIASAENQNFDGTWEVIPYESDNFVGYNMNRAFEQSTGTWIKKLDEDDLLTPNSLQDLFTFASGGYDWVWADSIQFTDEEEWIFRSGRWFDLKDLKKRNCIHGGSGLYHRKTFIETGGWDENLWTAEEYDWHLLLTSKDYQRGYLPKVVYRQRMHPGSKYNIIVNERNAERIKLRRQIIARYEI